MLKKLILTSLFINSIYAQSINIAVAANVSYAIEALKKEFNKLYPDIKVNITLGGSGKLTAQIINGAPYNLFMSANMQYPNALYSNGLTINKPLVYAQGSLALFSIKSQNFSQGMRLIKSSNIKKIAVANPKTAPYGKATLEAIKNSDIYNKIKQKFIYGESISQTLSYILVAADIGFIAKSALYSPKMSMYKKGVNWIDIDSKLYTPINQGIVILNNAKNNDDVLSFYHFMLSSKAKKILNNFGYLVQ